MKSSHSDVQTLAARVEKLESSNRRWKLANAVLLLLGVSILLMGAKPVDRLAAAAKPDHIDPNVLRVRSVEAQEFVLKDEDAHVYARLSLSPSLPGMKHQNGRTYLVPNQTFPAGDAALQFYNEKGEVLWTAPSLEGAQFLPAR